jgi:hypothetical protein
LKDARNARFEQTGEPSESPDHNDAARERAITATRGNKGGKKKK